MKENWIHSKVEKLIIGSRDNNVESLPNQIIAYGPIFILSVSLDRMFSRGILGVTDEYRGSIENLGGLKWNVGLCWKPLGLFRYGGLREDLGVSDKTLRTSNKKGSSLELYYFNDGVYSQT